MPNLHIKKRDLCCLTSPSYTEKLNKKEDVGVIVILHDLNLTLRYATHIAALKKGQIAFEGSADKLLDEQTLSALYESPIRLIDHPAPAKTAASEKVAVVCE